MSATLTQAQRDRLASREVHILRGLILDMVGDAEDAAIEYALGCRNGFRRAGYLSAASGDRLLSARAVLEHGHRTLSRYVTDDSAASPTMLGIWDYAARGGSSPSKAALDPWRARLAAALAIPEPAADVPVDYMEILRAAGYNTVDEILRTREDALACVVGIGPILVVRIKRELRAKREAP